MALVDSRLRVSHSTPGFGAVHSYEWLAPDEFPDLELVLTGQAESGRMEIGDHMFAVEAVTTVSGGRQALLTGGGPGCVPDANDPVHSLRASLDASRAIAWVKDLDGRYIYVNPPFLAELETSAERVLGRTDTELEPGETVDGPRVASGQESQDEPRQLEYTVPAFEDRTELAVLRFVLRDRDSQAAAVCGVAAPLRQAQLARDEARRLMQLERWARMGPAAVRAELFQAWGIADSTGSGGGLDRQPEQAPPASSPAPGPHPTAPPVRDPELERRGSQLAERLQAETHHWMDKLEQTSAAMLRTRAAADDASAQLEAVQAELTAARSALDASRADLERTRQEHEELERMLSAERARQGDLVRAIGEVRSRTGEPDGTYGGSPPARAA